MNLIIPVDCDKRHEALLTTLDTLKYWAFIEFDEGQIVNCKFYKNRKDIEAWVETVVVINESEYVWEFTEDDITVLFAPTQRSIDEISEAFLLKELHELSN